MTAATMTLTDFLLARIAEDEAVARAAGPDGGEWFSRRPESPEYHNFGEFGWVVSGADVETHDSEWGRSVADHVARHDPGRVLAECAAKRAIVEYATGTHTSTPEGYEIVELLAIVYADHPDYRDEWHP